MIVIIIIIVVDDYLFCFVPVKARSHRSTGYVAVRFRAVRRVGARHTSFSPVHTATRGKTPHRNAPHPV